jgi:ADP-heptose:LPS heptosyltransferase
MRVLALFPGGISDQILFFPTLEDIKRAFPKAEIDVVIEPRARPAYRVSKLVDEVIPFDYRAQNSPADWANLLGIIRDREFEVALSASGRWEEGVLLWLSGIPTRVTFAITRTPWLYTRTVPLDISQPQSQQYHNLLQGLGVTSTCPALSLNLPERDIAWAEAIRSQMGLTGGYVVMYPGSSSPAQGLPDRYPVDSWVTIIQDFQVKQPQLSVVLLRTPESQADVEHLTQRCANLKVVQPENLGQTAALVAGADLVLTPDSEVMQLAVALKVFTLALLGSSTPTTILPPTDNGQQTRFLALRSATEKLADLPSDTVLKKVWGG